jgi:hypothetical protein
MSDSEMCEDDSWGCEAQEHEPEKYGDGCHTFSEHEAQEHEAQEHEAQEHEAQEHEAQDTWGSQDPDRFSDCGEMEVDAAGPDDGMEFGPTRIVPFAGTHSLYDDDGNLIRPAEAAAEAAAALATRPCVWLEFCGTTLGAGLQERIELHGHPIVVGRATHPLHSAVQPEMVSRYHIEIMYNPVDATWALQNKSAMNGTLLKRVGETQSRRVEQGSVGDGDIITFDGARNTEVGKTPSEKAKESIYVYVFRSPRAPGSGSGSRS